MNEFVDESEVRVEFYAKNNKNNRMGSSGGEEEENE